MRVLLPSTGEVEYIIMSNDQNQTFSFWASAKQKQYFFKTDLLVVFKWNILNLE